MASTLRWPVREALRSDGVWFALRAPTRSDGYLISGKRDARGTTAGPAIAARVHEGGPMNRKSATTLPEGDVQPDDRPDTQSPRPERPPKMPDVWPPEKQPPTPAPDVLEPKPDVVKPGT